jgi:hypothetical protein
MNRLPFRRAVDVQEKVQKRRGPKAPELLDNLGDFKKVRVELGGTLTFLTKGKVIQPHGFPIPIFLSGAIHKLNGHKHTILTGTRVNGDSGPCPLDGLGKGREGEERVHQFIGHFLFLCVEGIHSPSMVIV